jgi:histidinol-phosphate/aromatic aminotransferase/cobyric acid decarboxylase-like protein
LECFRLPDALRLSVGTEAANRLVVAALSAFMAG